MKPVFKGTLTVGLVNVPIKLYSAIDSQSLGFTLLHDRCKTPLKYQRYCQQCDQIVEWANVIKGMKLPDGSYFLITKDNLEKLKPAHSDTITIVEFVDVDKIMPIYYDTHYYMAPAKVTEKAYFLLKNSLQELGKVAIARYVMREKEYVCAISPYENGLLLSNLNYAYEIRSMSAIEELSVAVQVRTTQQEKRLLEQLIKKMTKKSFDMSAFKDTFAVQLKNEIKRAKEGKKLLKKRAQKMAKERAPDTLTRSLKESLEQAAKRTQKGAKKKK